MTNELEVISLILFYVVLFTFLVVYLGCVQYLHYSNYFLYYDYDQRYCVRGYILLQVFNFLCIPFKQHYVYSMFVFVLNYNVY